MRNKVVHRYNHLFASHDAMCAGDFYICYHAVGEKHPFIIPLAANYPKHSQLIINKHPKQSSGFFVAPFVIP